MLNAGLDDSQAGIKTAGRNIYNLSYANDTILTAESEEELKTLLMKVKKKSEKAGLKLNIEKMKIMASGSITSWQIDGETMETVRDFIFLGSKITSDDDCSHEIKRCLLLGRKVMTNIVSILQSRDFANKSPSSQSYGFSISHAWMWELDHKEGWMPKNWCFWTVALEKTLKSLQESWSLQETQESPLDGKEIQPVHPKWSLFWMFLGRTDVEAKAPILWPPDVKSWIIWKDPDAGKDWRQEKGMTEDEMLGWHHQLNGHEFEQVLVDGEKQGSLPCCSPWGCTEDEQEQLLELLEPRSQY